MKRARFWKRPSKKHGEDTLPVPDSRPDRHDIGSSLTEEPEEPRGDGKGPLGLTLLHAPDEPLVDFIFVHGLGGGSRRTWTNTKKPSHYWPKQWLPKDPDFKHVRVHTFGYKADWGERAASFLNVDDFARSLLGEIANSPDIRRSDTSIVLIGHSMGGIVIKKTYVLSRQDMIYEEVASRIHTLFFLATPHRGSDLAQTLTKILKVTYGQKPFVTDLDRNSGLIHSINETFRYYHTDVHLWSFYETLESTIALSSVMIVDKSSAVLGYSNERTAPLNADHRGVVKFDLPSDPNYITIRNALSSTVDSIIHRVPKPEKEPSRRDLGNLKVFLGVVSSPEDDLSAVGERKLPDSCRWLAAKPEFQSWIDLASTSPPIFWLTGMAGCGKSVISSHVINRFEEEKLQHSYFFFKDGIDQKSTLSDLLRSLAYQMALGDVPIRKQLLVLAKDGITFGMTDDRTIWRKLFVNGIFTVKPSAPHYWVIDGLDEYNVDDLDDRSGVQAIFPMLADVGDKFPVRLFITSRKTREIELGIQDLGDKAVQQEIRPEDTLVDIRAYITSRLDRLPAPDIPSRLALLDRVLTKAAGSFLWVRLVVQELEKVYSEEAMTEILDDVPTGMNNLYARIFEKIPYSSRTTKVARTILSWTVCAVRPLTVTEMEYAIKVTTGETIPRLEKVLPTLCGQLAFVDQQMRIQVIHQTVKDYIINGSCEFEFAVNKAKTNMRIAAVCLDILAGSAFHRTYVRTRRSHGKVSPIMETSLLDYACVHFSDHVYKSSSADHETMTALCGFFKSNILEWIEDIAKYKESYHITRTAVNIKAYLGRRANHYPPMGTEYQLVEGWTSDLIRITPKYQTNLVACPSSIYHLIPALYPTDSMIYKMGSSRSKGVVVKGLEFPSWDDNLIQIDFKMSRATTLSHGHRHFAVGLSTGRFVIYYAETGRVHIILDHEERVRLVKFGAEDEVIVSSGQRNVRVWNVHNGQQLYVFDTPRQALAIKFSSDNTYLMVATQDNAVRFLRLELETPMQEKMTWCVNEERQQRPPSTHAAFSPEGELLAVGYRGLPILLYDLELDVVYGNLIRHADGGQDSVVCMVFNPNRDLNFFIASYHDGELAIFDLEIVKLLQTVPGVNAHALACSPDGRTLVTGSPFGTIQIFDFDGRDWSILTLIYHINAYDEGIKELAFSTNNLRFLDIRASQCRVWEPAVLVRRIHGDGTTAVSDPVPLVAKTTAMFESERKSGISTLACHHTGSFVFCGKEDGSVAVYATNDGLKLCELYRHETGITSIALSNQASIITSADQSGRVIVRELVFATDKWSASIVLANIRLSYSIRSLLLSPDNSAILICGKEVTELRSTAGEEIEAISTLSKRLQSIIQHPHMPGTFIISDHETARIFHWKNLLEITTGGGIVLEPSPSCDSESRCTWLHGQDILVQFSKGVSMDSPSTLSCWDASQFDFKAEHRQSDIVAKPLPGFDALESRIEQLISVVGNRLLFLDTDLWVCSLDLKTFATTMQVKRHFFIPSDWKVTYGETV